VVENDDERRKRQNEEREDELRRIPLQEIDKAKWPRGVREIAMHETVASGSTRMGDSIGTERPSKSSASAWI